MLPALSARTLSRFVITSALAIGLHSIAFATERLAPALSEQKAIELIDASAETLYSITNTTLKEDGHWQQKSYVSVRVNDLDAARDYGRIHIRFNHYYSDIELDFANTISSEGRIESVSQDALQQRVTGGGQDFYSDSSEIVFSLPDISPGSILEFQYTRKSKVLAFKELFTDFVSPFWYQNTVGQDGWRADYVHNHSYTLVTPAKQKIYSKAFSKYPKRGKTKKSADLKYQTWTLSNISGIRSEHWMPNAREFLPSLQLSTLKDWRTVNDWSWEKIEDKLKPTEQLKNIITQLNLPEHASNEEKVQAVYGYLQKKIRYVFAHLGRGGYEPHFPDEVLKVNYGDCKDQSVLTVALLRMLGVNAYPALVETPRSGDADTDLVDLIFDHMIVYIPESENVSTQWLDTTGDRSLYPGMSNYLAGQNAMIVNEKGGKLTHIPELGKNIAKIEIDYSSAQNKVAKADVKFIVEGYYEQNIRNWLIHSNDKENQINQYLASMFTASAVDTFHGNPENLENIWQPVSINAQYVFKQNEEDTSSYGASIMQGLNLFTSIANLPLPKTRQLPFNDRYDYEVIIDVNFKGNPGQIPALVQSNDDIISPYYSLTYKTSTEDHIYKLKMHFKRHKLDLSTAEYQSYFDDIKKIEKNAVWLVKMFDSKEKQKESSTLLAKQNHGADSLEYLIALSRQYIKQGKFADALAPAQKAVDKDSQNGEAWYVLGMAQGFNALIDESNASFVKAEQLGYMPN